MRARGRRKCHSCGTLWSYFDAGSITCPSCGSARSEGTDTEPVLHTAGAATFDPTGIRQLLEAEDITTAIRELEPRCRVYLRDAGFIDHGTLLPLEDSVVAIAELLESATHLDMPQAAPPSVELEAYLFDLVESAMGGPRPGGEAVPDQARHIRALGVARAVRMYFGECHRWMRARKRNGHPAIGAVRTHIARIEALEGDIDPSSAEAILDATRAIGEGLRHDDVDHFTRAESQLADLRVSPTTEKGTDRAEGRQP